ncbi:MAG: hypothetical protein QW076_04655 [Candidatus Anstonellales archaeon]
MQYDELFLEVKDQYIPEIYKRENMQYLITTLKELTQLLKALYE